MGRCFRHYDPRDRFTSALEIGVIRMRIKLLFFLALPLVLWMLPASAQISSATLVGTVKDPTGAVVGGAKVEAKNNATGAVRSATTDGSGEYAIPNLIAGRYA